MSKKKFQDIFWFAPKSNIKAGEGLDEGRFPFYTSSQVLSKFVNTEQHFDEALIFGTGGSASIHYADEPFSTSTDCLVAIATDKNFNTKFVYYYLLGNIQILERGFKGAGLQHISKTYIQNIEIPIYDLEIQNKIVAILDKSNALVQKRQKIIDLLDELLRSQFLEMFGIKNPDFKKWREVEIQDLAKKKKGSMRTGPFGSSLKHDEFTEEGDVAVLGIDNAVNNEFRWDRKRFITKDRYQESFSQYTVFPRDVIITIMGTVGRSAVIPQNIPLAINTKHLVCITLDESKCNPYYLAYSIHSNPFISFQMKARNRGSIMEGLNLGIIKTLKLKDAPISLQNKFEKIYLKVTANKITLQTSIYHLNELMGALIQNAFTGKLAFNTALELDSLLQEIDLKNPLNDLGSIITNEEYLEKLVNRLNEQDFENQELYNKAKHVAFQLLKQEERLTQEYNKNSKSLKLVLK